MNLNHLKYFYFVAQNGGFTKAALALKINQPGVTKAVQELENQLGCKLLKRSGRNTVLTERGNEVFRYCEVLFSQVDKIENACFSRPKECIGELVVGCSESVANHLLPQVVEDLLIKHPKIYPSIISSLMEDLLLKLDRGLVDLVIGFYFPKTTVSYEVIYSLPIKHYLVISSKHYKSKKVRESFIGSRETEDKQVKKYPTLQRLQEDYPEAAIKISSNCQSAHLGFVKKGLGVSILPSYLVEADLQDGVLKKLYAYENFVWPIQVVAKRGVQLSSKVEAFINSFTNTFE